MYISNRNKLIFAGVILLIALLLMFFFWPSKRVVPTPTANTNSQTNSQTNIADTTPKPTPVVTPKEQAQASAETVAKVFAERYGSYSSESEAANLEDVLPLATTGFATELSAQIARLQASTTEVAYYGVSTRVLNATLETMNDDSTVATYTVLTQREEAKGSASNVSVSYQTLELTLQRSGDNWLIGGARWK